MKYQAIRRFALIIAGACALGISSAYAQTNVPSTFKHITIDGSFSDWAGVPLAYTTPVGPTNAIQYENVYIANDQNNLYIRFTLYSPRPDALANSYDNIFVDTDTNAATGFPVNGGAAGVGSEMLIQGGAGYQEKNGGFNEGAINNLGWQIAGSADGTDFELAISRGATYASDGSLVFDHNTTGVVLEGDDTSYTSVEFAPTYGGFVYTFASTPVALSTNLSLVTLANSSWQVNASGADLGTNWLGQTYDDTQAGWSSGLGLFGYTPAPASYPAINTSLSSGPNTYYFRTRFQWTNDTADVAFVVTNYLSDGAVYYLNGAEIKRIRMPAGTISYSTAAAATNSPVGHADIFGFNGGVLQSGTNILEVETHQAPSSSADMVFGLSLSALTNYPVLLVDSNQPSDQTVLAGQPATFTSDIIGSGPLAYQWFFNGTNAIAGANGSTYTIPMVLTNNAGTYTLAASNAFSGVITRSALLTVSNTPITLMAEPSNVVTVEGRPATLGVTVSGTPIVQYQWFHNSTPISDATNASYSITSSTPADSGSYYVSVNNPAGTTNSSTATLTVLLDTIPPAITNIAVGATQVTITFSEPVDSVTAGNAANYSISGGVSVSSAIQNPNDASQVILTTTALNLGTVYALTVNGVEDLYGNAAHITADFARDITIDGSFDDWTGLTPVYSTSAPSGNVAPDGYGAADFKDIYVYNDANYYYFRVTLWSDISNNWGQFPYYVNMFFNTDNDPSTGFQPPIGSEMLVQSGYSYQEKDGNFNDGFGSINGLDWLSLPAAPGTNFEFRMSMAATFPEDGTPVFTTNVIQFIFQGMDPDFDVVNTIPASGGTIGYTNAASVSVPALPLGRLAIDGLPGGKAAIVWDSPGTLQSCTNLTNPIWTNVPSATGPYVVPASGTPRFFRLIQ